MRSYSLFTEATLGLIDILIIFFAIDNKLKDNEKNNFIVKSVYCLTLLVIDILSKAYSDNNLLIGIFIFISISIVFIYLHFFKVGEIYQKVYISVKYISFLIIVAYTIMMVLEMGISIYIRNNVYDIFALKIFFSIIMRSTLALITFLLLRYRKSSKRANKVNRNFISAIIMLIVCVVGTIGIKDNVFSLIFSENEIQSSKMLNIPMVICFFNIFFIAASFDYEKSVEVEMKLENEMKKYELEKKYNDEVYQIYKEMKAWRHDYRNNIQAIGSLAKCGDIEGIKNYILNLNVGLDDSERIVYTGNNIIDSILTTKILMAKSYEINFDLKIDKITKINIDNIDLSTLLANLLDNSIEACQRVNTERFVKVSIVNIKKQLIIIVENSTDGNIKYVDGKYLTSKTHGNHGIVMGQIDKIISKYNGYINREYDNVKFKTTILFSGVTVT